MLIELYMSWSPSFFKHKRSYIWKEQISHCPLLIDVKSTTFTNQFLLDVIRKNEGNGVNAKENIRIFSH